MNDIYIYGDPIKVDIYKSHKGSVLRLSKIINGKWKRCAYISANYSERNNKRNMYVVSYYHEYSRKPWQTYAFFDDEYDKLAAHVKQTLNVNLSDECKEILNAWMVSVELFKK